MRVAFCFAVVLVAITVAADEIDLTVSRSEVQTVANTPMEFRLEKSAMQDGALRFWGEVKNGTNKTFRFVRVVATARSVGGRVLGRTESFVEPDTIGPGMSGHVNAARIPCDGVAPERLEYSVMGNAAR